jgi:hypothetical protein
VSGLSSTNQRTMSMRTDTADQVDDALGAMRRAGTRC